MTNEDWMTRLYALYHTEMVLRANRIVRNWADAEDVFQTVFKKWWVNIQAMRAKEDAGVPIRATLRVAIHNESISWLRKLGSDGTLIENIVGEVATGGAVARDTLDEVVSKEDADEASAKVRLACQLGLHAPDTRAPLLTLHHMRVEAGRTTALGWPETEDLLRSELDSRLNGGHGDALTYEMLGFLSTVTLNEWVAVLDNGGHANLRQELSRALRGDLPHLLSAYDATDGSGTPNARDYAELLDAGSQEMWKVHYEQRRTVEEAAQGLGRDVGEMAVDLYRLGVEFGKSSTDGGQHA